MALATVVHPALAPSRRILAVSDIHGNRAFFRGLLEKAAFSSRDILVLVGDILEKGPDSLGLLRDILELSQDHTILPVCGNCDGWSSVSLKMTCGTKAFSGSIFPPTRRVSCARWPGKPALTAGRPAPPAGVPAPDLPLGLGLAAFPAHILESEHLVFVHGGVPPWTAWRAGRLALHEKRRLLGPGPLLCPHRQVCGGGPLARHPV